MPELPEVQTVVSQLERKVTGKKVTGFWSDWKKKVLDSYLVFVKKVTGATLLGARRFGKHIVIDLDNGFSILIHIKMTGQLIYVGPNLKTKDKKLSAKITGGLGGKHTHIIFHLDKGGTLY